MRHELPAITRNDTAWLSLHYIDMKHITVLIKVFLWSEKYTRHFIKTYFYFSGTWNYNELHSPRQIYPFLLFSAINGILRVDVAAYTFSQERKMKKG